jgi:cyclase
VAWAREVEDRGAGEILLTSIDREGTWSGFDIGLIRSVTDVVSIPVIAHGGAGSIEDIGKAVHQGHASAVAIGSMVVYQKKSMGVLVHFPDPQRLSEVVR